TGGPPPKKPPRSTPPPRSRPPGSGRGGLFLLLAAIPGGWAHKPSGRRPPARGRTVAHRWLFWANPTFVASAQWRAFLVMAFIPNSAPTLSAAHAPASSLAQSEERR